MFFYLKTTLFMADSGFTIYTLGDTETFETILNGIAMVFQSDFFNGNGPFGLGYGLFLGAAILLTMGLYQSIFSKRLELKTLITPLVLYIILTMPKADVILVDVYNQAPVKRVSSIPLGLALPMNFMSGVAYSFTESMETSYSTPTSPRLLTDGFVSPLKTLYSLRYVNISEENPYLAEMINGIYRQCVMYSTTFDVNEYKNSPDSYRYFTTFLTNQAKGIVVITDRNGTASSYSCAQSAGMLDEELQGYINGDGSTTGSLNYNFKRGLNSALMLQENNGLLPRKDSTDLLNSFRQVTDLGFEDGRLFMLNTLFNQPLQTASLCATNSANEETTVKTLTHCSAWIQGEEQLSENNAAGATGFLSIMQNGQNILLILALLLYPFIVIMIMYMGMKAMTAVSGYLMFIASIYLWMPMAAIVNFYAISKLRNTLNQMGANDTFALSDYPAFYQAVSEALSIANAVLATLPVFCMMFFSGMTMAVVGMMRRLDVTKSGHYDATVNANNIDKGAPFANRTSSTMSNGLGSVTDRDGGKAFTSSFSNASKVTASGMVALQQQKQLLQSQAHTLISEVNQIDGLTVNGLDQRTSLTNIHSKSENRVLDGSGFSQEHTESNSGAIHTKGVNKAIKATETDGRTYSNIAGAAVEAGFGVSIGKGTTFQQSQLNADGSPLTNIDGEQLPTSMQSQKDNAYSLGRFQVLAGTDVQKKSIFQNMGTENSQINREVPIYNGKGSDQEALSIKNYSVDQASQEQIKQNNNGDEHVKNVSFSSHSSTQNLTERRNELVEQLSDTNSKLEQVNRQIANTVSAGFVTNLLDTDVMHRIKRYDSVKTDLDKVSEMNQEKYGSAWNHALKNAEEQMMTSGLAVSKQANPEEYEYYKIALAGMQFDYNSSSAVFKALTGFDYGQEELDRNLRSANLDWNNLNVDTSALNKGMDDLFGKMPVGQMTYLAGALNVHGDQQQRNMIMVYNAFLSAGFSARQAAILTAEVGRENSFNDASLFGTHYDPKKAHIVNGGMISFNQDRKKDLDKVMFANGLVEKGGVGTASYVKGQASLNIMAAYMYKELTTEKKYASSWKALNDDSLTKDQVHYAVGKNYIVWRVDDAAFNVNGNKNRKFFAEKLDTELQEQAKLQYAPSPLSGIRGADLSSANELTKALSKTGLKGKILGNGFVDNSYISSTGLPIKAPSHNKDQAYGGGQSRGYTVEFAHLANQQLGNKIRYFSGFNDEYHKNVGSTGKHVKGQAFDLVLNNSKDVGTSIKQMQQLAKKHGYQIAIVNEYESKSKDFTGQHLHVSVLGRNAAKNNVVSAVDQALDSSKNQFKVANNTKNKTFGAIPIAPKSVVPQGKGKSAIVSAAQIESDHANSSKELANKFNKTTDEKYGITLKKGEDNALEYNVKDLAKVGGATGTGLPPLATNLSTTAESLKNVAKEVIDSDTEQKILRTTAQDADERPHNVSMYNIKQQQDRKNAIETKTNKQKADFGVSTSDIGKNQADILKNKLDAEESLGNQLKKVLEEKRHAQNPYANPDMEALRKQQEQQRGM